MKREHSFLSSDKMTKIHVVSWYPQGEVIGVIQIAHGMDEFIERYDRFARFLNQYGYIVVGNDHLGHGLSVMSDRDLGFFRQPGGNEAVIADMRRLHVIMKKKYPGIPYYLLGHSMGSFFTREYIEKYGQDLTGAIIMGTGSQPKVSLKMGKALCRTIAVFRGWGYRSGLVESIAFGAYNKRFEPARTKYDWLTKDESIVDAYRTNPLNTFRFTLNGYYSMFTAIEAAQDRKKIAGIPKNLPLLLVSGSEDPVGNYGAGVETAYRSYKKAGIQEVQMHLFENDRHEILNEQDHGKVDRFLLDWLDQHGN